MGRGSLRVEPFADSPLLPRGAVLVAGYGGWWTARESNPSGVGLRNPLANLLAARSCRAAGGEVTFTRGVGLTTGSLRRSSLPWTFPTRCRVLDGRGHAADAGLMTGWYIVAVLALGALFNFLDPR